MVQALAAALGWRPEYLYVADVCPFYTVARPGFFGGFGEWVDLFSPLEWNYPRYQSVEEASAVSTYADWCLIGQDLAIVMEAKAPRLALNGEADPATATRA